MLNIASVNTYIHTYIAVLTENEILLLLFSIRTHSVDRNSFKTLWTTFTRRITFERKMLLNVKCDVPGQKHQKKATSRTLPSVAPCVREMFNNSNSVLAFRLFRAKQMHAGYEEQ